jgi:hypothetical protein
VICAQPARFLRRSRSDSLAADFRPRRCGRRCVVFDRLHGLGLFGSHVILVHALLERLEALRDVAHQVGNLAAAEQQQDDCDHDDPMPNAKRTHLQPERPAIGLI